jgi:hypothetical protein
MLHFEINQKKYQLWESAADVSVERYIALLDFQQEKMPASLKELHRLQSERVKMEASKEEEDKERLADLVKQIERAEKDLEKLEEETIELLNYKIQLVSFAGNIPANILQRLEHSGFEMLFLQVLAVLHQISAYEPKFIKSLYFKDENWLLPAEKHSNLTLGQFVQAEEYKRRAKDLENGFFKAILYLLPLILHKEGEEFDIEISRGRQNLFKDIPVLDALDIAFFLTSKVQSLKLYTSIYSTAAALSKLKRRKRQ